MDGPTYDDIKALVFAAREVSGTLSGEAASDDTIAGSNARRVSRALAPFAGVDTSDVDDSFVPLPVRADG